MSETAVRLEVLLVDDDLEDLRQFLRDLPSVFEGKGVAVTLHSCEDFDEAAALAADPSRRFDLIVSDTYRGHPRNGDAQVMRMVRKYRGNRFCPLVVYSSGTQPSEFQATDFVVWADKSKAGDIERAIGRVLDTGVPQIGRRIHDELDLNASSYLWEFLEKEWPRLSIPAPINPQLLSRLVRRRAAVQIADIDPVTGTGHLSERDGAEYYIYPALEQDHFSLGDIVRRKDETGDLRVVLTPHCHLMVRPGQAAPRADHILTVKAVPAGDVLGQKLENARNDTNEEARNKKLAQWARSPAQTRGKPEGRHWYLPGFLDIPHSFCDFVQAEALPHVGFTKGYDRIATLASPYAEALQACFVSYYSTVGIPDVRPDSIKMLLAAPAQPQSPDDA